MFVIDANAIRNLSHGGQNAVGRLWPLRATMNSDAPLTSLLGSVVNAPRLAELMHAAAIQALGNRQFGTGTAEGLRDEYHFVVSRPPFAVTNQNGGAYQRLENGKMLPLVHLGEYVVGGQQACILPKVGAAWGALEFGVAHAAVEKLANSWIETAKVRLLTGPRDAQSIVNDKALSFGVGFSDAGLGKPWQNLRKDLEPGTVELGEVAPWLVEKVQEGIFGALFEAAVVRRIEEEWAKSRNLHFHGSGREITLLTGVGPTAPHPNQVLPAKARKVGSRPWVVREMERGNDALAAAISVAQKRGEGVTVLVAADKDVIGAAVRANVSNPGEESTLLVLEPTTVPRSTEPLKNNQYSANGARVRKSIELEVGGPVSRVWQSDGIEAFRHGGATIAIKSFGLRKAFDSLSLDSEFS